MNGSALIVVTHLLGVGHLARAMALGRALVAAGWRVVLASGGRPAPLVAAGDVEVVQLPPVHCLGTDFRTLHGPDGLADAAQLAARRDLLLATLARVRPDVVITELWPFGRRQLGGEFTALAEAVSGMRPRPALLCSIRDVLNPPSKPARVAAAGEMLGRWFDGILFHGDPTVLPLAASWPEAGGIGRRVRPTGYLRDGAAGPVAPTGEGVDEVLVSGGGSAAGLPLARLAVAAAELTPGRRWRVLLGQGVPAAEMAALQSGAAIVERARADFGSLLSRAAVSVSQAGYNTVLDLAQAGVPAVLVPFDAGGEREQTIRAEALAGRGLARVLPLAGLTLAGLAGAVAEAPRPDWSGVARDGAARSVVLIETEAAAARARDVAWRRLEAVLAARSGPPVPVWLRDDDATAATPALEAFLAKLARHGLPACLAVIPGALEASLGGLLGRFGDTRALVHGWLHRNHAPKGAKAAEYPESRAAAEVAAELAEGLATVRRMLPAQAVAVFVPPWNRIAPVHVPALAGLGYAGLSCFAETRGGDDPFRCDTHWDPIAWRGDRGLRERAGLLDWLSRLLAEPGAAPLGLLTHHAVHDVWVDGFLDEVLGVLAASPAIRFVAVPDTGSKHPPVHPPAGPAA